MYPDLRMFEIVTKRTASGFAQDPYWNLDIPSYHYRHDPQNLQHPEEMLSGRQQRMDFQE